MTNYLKQENLIENLVSTKGSSVSSLVTLVVPNNYCL